MKLVGDIKLHDKTWIITAKKSKKTIIPLFGNISCGQFKLIDCEIDGYIEIPQYMIGKGDYFALRADGDSMIGAGINDGDIVIVEKNPSPENGQIAVVMIEEEVVLKRFYRLEDERKYLLHPENDDYDDMIVEKCTVLGTAIKIISDLK